MKDSKPLCRYLGGSQLYGLSTPESDRDERGVYMTLEPKYILGTARDNEERKQNAAIQQDVVFKELSHWVRLLAQSNTEAYEALFAKRESFTVYEPEFDLFRQNAIAFLDSKRLFNCLRGYAQSEFRLAKGERVGVLGSKRKQALDKYGYSNRNASHLLRLLWTGIFFFQNNHYVVDCTEFGNVIYDYIKNVKVNPETYSVDQLAKDYASLEAALGRAYEARSVSYHFNEAVANRLLLECYFPYLQLAFANKS